LYGALVLHVPRKKYLVAGMGWIILTVMWGFIRYHALGGSSEVTFSTQIISMVRNIPAVLPFLGKVIFPFDLSVFPILADMKISMVFGIIALVVIVFVCRFSASGQRTVCFFGFAWFLAFLIPSFVSINNQIPNFSEHRVYLSLAGLLLLFIQYRPAKTTVFYQKVTAGSMVALLLLFSVLSFLHTRNFKDQFAFWQNAVDTSPSHAFNYNNLGAMYFLNENLEQAEPLLRKAIQINPGEPMANGNLGLICMRTNRLEEAEKYYFEEIRINPAYDNVYYNLGLLYFNNSRPEEGILQWEKTLTINPSYTDAYQALLFAYEKLGRKDDYERIAAQAQENGISFQ
jgi:Tfp pilus assembly protein PilF